MAIWISTIVLVAVLAAIVRAEVRSGRRSRAKLAKTDEQINDLARVAFKRHREMFGKDATGTFPLVNVPDGPKK